MKKQPEITERTKDSFVMAFCQLYCQKPIETITIQSIATKAGYNRCTFYQYFKDVYDIRDYVEDDILCYIGNFFNNTTDKYVNPDIKNLFAIFNEKSIQIQSLLGIYGCSHFIKRMKENISMELFSRTVPASSEKIKPYLMEFHLSTTLSMFQYWLNNNMNLKPEELLSLIHNLYTSGVEYYDDRKN